MFAFVSYPPVSEQQKELYRRSCHQKLYKTSSLENFNSTVTCMHEHWYTGNTNLREAIGVLQDWGVEEPGRGDHDQIQNVVPDRHARSSRRSGLWLEHSVGEVLDGKWESGWTLMKDFQSHSGPEKTVDARMSNHGWSVKVTLWSLDE